MEETESQEPLLQEIAVPEHISRKPWMDYRAVTDEASEQYRLLQQAYHDESGLLYIDGHLAVALGSQFGPVGSRYTFVMSTGEEVAVIKADAKQDAHTAGGFGWTGTDGHLIEMIVDTDLLDEEAMLMGDCECLMNGTVERIYVE